MLNIKTSKTVEDFEQEAESLGFKIKHYRTDNAPFRCKGFDEHIQHNCQTIDFSGVGAHHENAVAERNIKTVTWLARTMLLHAMIMWPDRADPTLWPFALDYAVYMWNRMPHTRHNLAPIKLFTGTRFTNYDHIKCAHIFGCLTFVLDPKLQDHKKVPKWTCRDFTLSKFHS